MSAPKEVSQEDVQLIANSTDDRDNRHTDTGGNQAILNSGGA